MNKTGPTNNDILILLAQFKNYKIWRQQRYPFQELLPLAMLFDRLWNLNKLRVM
jgi:hypothetical protein